MSASRGILELTLVNGQFEGESGNFKPYIIFKVGTQSHKSSSSSGKKPA